MKEKVKRLGNYLGKSLSNFKVNSKRRRSQGLINRTLAVFLIATLIFTSSNLQGIKAAVVGETSTSLTATDTNEVVNKDPAVEEAPIISELKEKRTLNTKTFLHEDNTMTTATYPTNVFYEDETGELKEIDNSLILSGTEYINKNNSFKVTFADDVMKENLYKIREKGYGLDFSLKDDLKEYAKAEKQAMKAEVVNDPDTTAVEKENIKKSSAQNIGSGLIYRDVKPSIDLEYILQGSGLKENIIIKEKVADASLSFELNVTGLIIGINDKENIELKDKTTGKGVYEIPKPFMYDKNNESTDKVEVVLEKISETKATIKYIPDSTWLNAEGRAFPVVVDPPVYSSNNVDDIHDTFVVSNDATDKWLNLYIRAGRSSNGGTYRGYVHVPLPAIGSGDVVIKSTMNLYADGGVTVGTNNVYVHRNTSTVLNGTYQGTLWSNQQSVVAAPDDYQVVSAGTSGWEYFDITEIAKGWYLNNNNFGISLRADASATGSNAVFRSSDTTSTSVRPRMLVQYINTTGIEGYQTYHTQSAGRAGTVYVNDYTGDITIEKPIMVEKGEINPLSISAYYNGHYRANSGILGYGWNLNISQYVLEKSGTLFADGKNRILYQDEDGTQHYYVWNAATSKYEGEDNKFNDVTKVSISSALTYKMDNGDSILYFNTAGKLSRIVDNNGNYIDFTYDAAKKPISATGKNVKNELLTTTTFTYDASNRISKITDSRGKEYIFAYTTGNCLFTITDPDGAYSKYTYNSNEQPLWVYGSTGGYYYYTYTTYAPYRVSKIFERPSVSSFDTATAPGMAISFGHNSTTFTDFEGRKNTYQYNNLGQCTGVVDNDGNAIFNSYGSTGNQNNLKSQSKVEQTIVNFLMNSSFQHDDTKWAFSNGSGGSTGIGSFSTAEKYSDSRSYKIDKTNSADLSSVSQNATLSANKTYTLSGYVKTTAMDNDSKAYLKVTYGSGLVVKSDEITSVKDWERYSATFTMPSSPATYPAKVELVIEGGVGTAYFDAIQLEEGATANRFNLIDNGSFASNLDYFTKGGIATYGFEIARQGRNGIYINGGATTYGNVSQRVYEGGSAGDSFVFGAWGKANSAPVAATTAENNRRFSLEVNIKYSDETTGKWISYQKFNDAYTDWQYMAVPFVAEKAYDYITVYATYNYNLNKVTFTDFHVYKEKFGTKLSYDGNGNLDEVEDESGNVTDVTVDANDNLTSITEADGSTSSGAYTSEENLDNTTSDLGVVTDYKYTPEMKRVESEWTKNSTGYKRIMHNEYTYSPNENFTIAQSNGDDYEITNHWDQNYILGRIDKVTDSMGGQTEYSYDSAGRVSYTVTKMNDTENISTQTNYISDKLDTIIHNGFTYDFDYDSYGYLTNAKVGSISLVSNIYDNNTHMLTKSTYGNGDYFEPVYDDHYQIIEQKYNGVSAYKYKYGSQGEVVEIQDIINGVTTNHLYNEGVLTKTVDSLGNSWVLGYDQYGSLENVTKSQFGIIEKESKSEDETQRTGTFTISSLTAKIFDNIMTTDDLGRLDNIEVKNSIGDNIYSKGYTYNDLGTETDENNNPFTKTTNLVEKETWSLSGETAPKDEYIKEYTYYPNGNLWTITVGNKVTEYFYDFAGQLEREIIKENGVETYRIDYVYDTGGNIETKTRTDSGQSPITISYGYDSVWKDKLVSFDGKAITYPTSGDIGNPLSIGDATLTWIQGRKLSTFKADSSSTQATYTYDENGIRKTKNVGNEIIEYITNGGEVVAERSDNGTPADSSDDVSITFNRGVDGSLVSMNRNGVYYYYVTNIQGDVEKILDSNGTDVVDYTYSSFGEVSVGGTLASTIGDENPFRYRSYYFDTESGYYYLQSRYYSPEIGRFINADEQLNPSVLGNNTFAYCENNYINMVDREGNIAVNIIVAALNYSYNKTKTFEGYIFGQGYGNASKLKFGLFRGSYNGCGWIATYNATVMLGNPVQPAKIIKSYEGMTAALGVIGIYPFAVYRYFRHNGYKVTMTYNINKFDEIAKKNKANIVFYFHRRGAHYFASQWNGRTFLNYNTYNDQKYIERFKSISDYLKDEGGWGYVLISIS